MDETRKCSYFNMASQLRSAMKGFGTNEDKIKRTLTSLTAEERIALHSEYADEFGRKLIDDLEDELSGNFERACVYSTLNKVYALAYAVKKAIKGAGTDENTLIAIFGTTDDVGAIARAYFDMFGSDMRDDVYDDVDGNAKLTHILQVLFTVSRGKGDALVPKHVDRLISAFKKGRYATVLGIFSSYTRDHLSKVSDAFTEATGKSIQSRVRDSFSGDVESFLLALCSPVEETWAEYATTNDSALLLTVATHNTEGVNDVMRRLKDVNLNGRLDDEVGGDTHEVMKVFF